MSKKNGKRLNKGESNGADGNNNLDGSNSQQDLDDDFDDDEDDDDDEDGEDVDESEEDQLQHQQQQNHLEVTNEQEKLMEKENHTVITKLEDYEDEEDQQKSPGQSGISSVFMTPSSIVGGTKSSNTTDLSPASSSSSSSSTSYSPNLNDQAKLIKKESPVTSSNTPPLPSNTEVTCAQNWSFYNNFTAGFDPTTAAAAAAAAAVSNHHFNSHYFNANPILPPLSSSSPSYMKTNFSSYQHQQQQQQQHQHQHHQQQDLYYNQRLQYSMANSAPFNNIYNTSIPSNSWSNQYENSTNAFAACKSNSNN